MGSPTVAVAALVHHPGRYAGAQVIVDAYVEAGQGACTQQVCAPEQPCCNCGYAPVLLERPVERVTGDIARLDLVWDPYLLPDRQPPAGWGCRQDPVSCAITCAPSRSRLVRVQARLEQEQGYYWLRVNDYCTEPG